MLRIASGALAFGLLTLAFAQEPNPTQSMLPPPPPTGSVPVFKVDVVSRSIPAINFHHRQGTTNVDLRGTALMPTAKGKVRVDSTAGATRMKAETTKMVPPETFGPEFLTYVLWAISPEGNAKNLGELVLKNGGDNSSIETTTSLQAFGLIVTAEPYWAVSQPSDVVVMENEVRNDTTGTIETIDAKYQLLRRGQYTMNVQSTALQPMIRDKRVPLQLREAREALAIARAQGADHYAADTIQKGLTDLQNAEGFYISRHNEKELETDARQATQMAEDARLISIREEAADALAAERKASADAQAAAQARAQQEAERAAQAAAQAREADSERAAAERARADAERAKAEAQQAQLMAENAKAQAQQEQLKAQQEAEAARAAASKAEQDKQAVRAQLLDQLNKIMETRDTARGLIMNMSDVLFDFGKATLRPEAREKLAKVSGILLAYPTLRVQIEGNTDNVGSDAFNQTLSEKRAFGVRDYLVAQGVDGNKLTAIGYGKSRPIASNDTAEGRQQNRRVELVLSGDVIGTPINQGPTTQGAPDGNPPAAQ
ncbi:OmpA family protein [Nevskia soli]|uniref:OmpA family protein n=1 Tax=Nevskia soli TaxID=418856 RepID=UPI0015D90F70|nr:OmpA family protein [Nevskia soli]